MSLVVAAGPGGKGSVLRVKTDPAIIDDLPEKIEIKQYCRLTAEQAPLYQAVGERHAGPVSNILGPGPEMAG